MANCDETLNILVGSVRSGKTISSLIAFLLLLTRYPDSNIMFVGKSDKTLYRNVLMPLKDIVGKSNFSYSRTIGEGKIYNHHFYTAGAYDEKSVDKIQGITLALAYGDEITTWPENFFQMLISRLSEYDAKFIGTCNPEGPYHWLKTNFLDREHEISLKSWEFFLDENKNLPPEYVVRLKQFYTGLFYKRYILGQWVLAEGAIYDMFSADRHVSPIPDEIWNNITSKHVSVDYGTNNPCVFQLWGNDGRKRYLKKEYYYDSKEHGRQKTDSEYAQDLIEFIGSEEVWSVIVDPSAASFKVELAKCGLSVQDADNNVLDGIREVSSGYSLDLIQIDPSCKGNIREKSGYVWDIKAAQRGEDKPIKQNDHCCFIAGTFITTSYGNIPIEQIQQGDKVLTRDGYKEVAACGITNFNEIVNTLTLNNKKTLTGTGCHPIFVEGKGFIRLDSLRYGDKLFQQVTPIEYPTLTKSNLMESNSEDTQVLKERSIENIIPRTQQIFKMVLKNYIKKYGYQNMEKFQKDIISTIRTGTHSIIHLITLYASMDINISKSTRMSRIKIPISLHEKESTVMRFDILLKNGMGRKRDGNGILTTEKKFINLELRLKGYASSVVRNLKISLERIRHGSVRMLVNLLGEGLLRSMKRFLFVSNVGMNSQLINIQNVDTVPEVVQVKEENVKMAVYNLTVEDAHEYFANGILVHNCDCERYYIKTVPVYNLITEKYSDDVGFGYIPDTSDQYAEY
ncbi:MAG: PBSX family phage terminase large subunit [Parabacteroides sp.]|nr:PBSX family phage terminase large subunit [Parabacteroides sp.]